MYVEKYNDFMASAKRFGDEYRKTGSNICRCEPNVTAEENKYIIESRNAEWNVYRVNTNTIVQ